MGGAEGGEGGAGGWGDGGEEAVDAHRFYYLAMRMTMVGVRFMMYGLRSSCSGCRCR